MGINGNHCSFVLLAEFHILEGAQLKYQFPQPLGVDESILAMSMLPDGAEAQLDDWTIFFLNQTPFNTISPVLALDTPETRSIDLPVEGADGGQGKKQDLLCVLNLVRTKHDKTLDRGAKVMALAICTRHPFIQIFKPLLLMALDDYFADPSQDCLARLFDAVNAIDLSAAPVLSRSEKLVMRSSERKDIFLEKFAHLAPQQNSAYTPGVKAYTHKSSNSNDSYSSFEDGLLMRARDRDKQTARKEHPMRQEENGTAPGPPPSQSRDSPSDSSFSLGGSAVWVGDETGLDLIGKESNGDSHSATSHTGSSTLVASSQQRRSIDASSSSSHLMNKELPSKPFPHGLHDLHRSNVVKDTHFYHTTVGYKDHQLPIKMPLATFAEEVGDYSLITLIKVFSNHQQVSGPLHPHLHTNGPQTHPIIILFNALVTGKRIIFLGHKRPAGEVSSFVLAACALASGCGAVLRGFIERAFPYANLRNRDDWESVPAYIAGVTNPIFEASKMWDLLLDISTGNVTVAKDIHVTYPVSNTIGLSAPLITRSGTLKPESSVGSEEEIARLAKEGGKDYQYKDNNADRIFIEDIRAAIEDHFGESLVRTRFTEYVLRFVRLASRYEEETTGSTKFGFPSSPFTEVPGQPPQLGSGLAFNDEASCLKELASNAHRIEAWKKTNSYQYLVADYAKYQAACPVKGFDLVHQLARFRYAKNMSDTETLAIMKTLADNVKTYEQVVELLACLPHGHGLLYIAFGLFHPHEAVRDATIDLFNQIRSYSVGVLFLQALNHFQRYAYVRQAHAKERRTVSDLQYDQRYPGASDASYGVPGPVARAHSNSVASDRSLNF
ncbi:MesA protein [Coprinopsis cinerea okayama7|uniref:MesA protein n=1 Tax=Coprinopsis cinerea (strain Okayama-7 / 130 / ATCC MYA-4618 / FGSC 9003) TaxID=240176 RepID=A8N5K3_COPC7|nr:MesA protein [Coprinopsis cinerea okayama7\|eukprot:XP_001830148.1 MesA protein [Coprinopsis cinerea okayama7\